AAGAGRLHATGARRAGRLPRRRAPAGPRPRGPRAPGAARVAAGTLFAGGADGEGGDPPGVHRDRLVDGLVGPALAHGLLPEPFPDGVGQELDGLVVAELHVHRHLDQAAVLRRRRRDVVAAEVVQLDEPALLRNDALDLLDVTTHQLGLRLRRRQ